MRLMMARCVLAVSVAAAALFCLWRASGAQAATEARPSVFREHVGPYGELARQVTQWPPWGVEAYLPHGALSRGEENIFNVVALLSVPLVVTDRFPADSKAAFFSMHALADRRLIPHMRRFLAGGRRAVITSRLASRLGGLPHRYADRIFVLNTERGPDGILKLPQTTVDHLRNFILYPLGLRLTTPPRVAVTLFGHKAILVENFNGYAAGVSLTLLRPVWPDVREIRTAAEVTVPIAYNQARMQVGPRTARLLRLVPRASG